MKNAPRPASSLRLQLLATTACGCWQYRPQHVVFIVEVLQTRGVALHAAIPDAAAAIR